MLPEVVCCVFLGKRRGVVVGGRFVVVWFGLVWFASLFFLTASFHLIDATGKALRVGLLCWVYFL